MHGQVGQAQRKKQVVSSMRRGARACSPHGIPRTSCSPRSEVQGTQNKSLLNKRAYECLIIKQHGKCYNKDAKCNQSVEEEAIYFPGKGEERAAAIKGVWSWIWKNDYVVLR